MKKLLLLSLLICLSHTGVSSTENKQIKVNVTKWKAFSRSMSSTPILSFNGNVIYIYSDQPLKNIEVTVSDNSGDIVYAGNLTVGADETISFTFDNTNSGEYLIEIKHGDKYLYGWIEIEYD